MQELTFWSYLQTVLLPKTFFATLGLFGTAMSILILSCFGGIILFLIDWWRKGKEAAVEKAWDKMWEAAAFFCLFVIVFICMLVYASFGIYSTEEQANLKLKTVIKNRPIAKEIEYQIINSTTSETPEEIKIRKEKIKKLQALIDLSAPLNDDLVLGQKPVSVLSKEVFDWFQTTMFSLKNDFGNDKAVEFLQIVGKSNYTWPSVPKDELEDFNRVQARILYLGDLKDRMEKCP